MRIALITSEYVTEKSGDGGLAGYLYRIAVTLRDMGHVPVVLVAADCDDQIIHDGVDVHRINVCHPVVDGLDFLTRHRLPLDWLWQSFVLNRTVLRLERKSSFDVLHYSSYMAVPLFRLSRVPAVIRLSSLQRMLHEANMVPRRMRERFLEKLEIRALKHGDLLFAPSLMLARKVEGLTGRPVLTLESPQLARPTKTDLTLRLKELEGKQYLLFFGTLSILKGLLTLADALPEILEEYPHLHFVAVGKEQDYQGRPMSDHLRLRVGRHAQRVHCFGKQERSCLDPIIQDALAVVLPSRVDNLSNACIEAMSHGKVVIATRGASFEQLIEDEKSGFLCLVDDPDDLQKAMRRLLQLTPEERQAMGEKARKRTKQLNPEKVVGELVELYEMARTQCPADRP